MTNPINKEQEYCYELGLMIKEAYKDPEIDPDQMMGFLLASLHFDQTIDIDRVDHFHKVGMMILEGDNYES